jgi:hypothetical protein
MGLQVVNQPSCRNRQKQLRRGRLRPQESMSNLAEDVGLFLQVLKAVGPVPRTFGDVSAQGAGAINIASQLTAQLVQGSGQVPLQVGWDDRVGDRPGNNPEPRRPAALWDRTTKLLLEPLKRRSDPLSIPVIPSRGSLRERLPVLLTRVGVGDFGGMGDPHQPNLVPQRSGGGGGTDGLGDAISVGGRKTMFKPENGSVTGTVRPNKPEVFG